MKLLPLLRKEILWSRHRILTLLFLLVVLPGCFVLTTVLFQTAVPENTPIAIVPETDAVSADSLTIVEGGLAQFSDPKRYENRSTAMAALHRESVYAVLVVPPGVLNQGTGNATFELYTHDSVVPFREPSKAITDILSAYLDRNLPGEVSVTRVPVGHEHTLSAYLVPVFLLTFLVVVAFTYLPYNLAGEAAVLDRLLVESSLEAVIATKIGYLTLLMVVPMGVFAAIASLLGYGLTLLSPGVVGTFLLTFVYLSAISATIMILAEFSMLGRFANVAVMFGLLTVSSLVYPVGFFSPVRKEIARQIPLHYSMIIARSLSLRGMQIGTFADWVIGLCGFTLVTLIGLKLAIERYTRTA